MGLLVRVSIDMLVNGIAVFGAEQAMLAQYQEMQTEMDLRLLEENSLCATVGSLSAGSNVICPICQK